MSYNFKSFEKKIEEVINHLSKELDSVRTGRATPAILDGVFVESYGSRVPINQVATVSIDDARSLRVSPWDSTQVKDIEKAIMAANLGVSVGADDRGVRIFFPELTGERRVSLTKLAKEKIEEARIALRGARDDVWSDIQQSERDGDITEDEKFRNKDDMQKHVDVAMKKFDDMLAHKEKELSL